MSACVHLFYMLQADSGHWQPLQADRGTGSHYRQTGAQAAATGRQGHRQTLQACKGHWQPLHADRGAGSHYKQTGAHADTSGRQGALAATTGRQGHRQPLQADFSNVILSRATGSQRYMKATKNKHKNRGHMPFAGVQCGAGTRGAVSVRTTEISGHSRGARPHFFHLQSPGSHLCQSGTYACESGVLCA